MSDRDERGGSWTLLTGHGRVLVEIGRDPGARIRDISAVVGLTERTVQVIVADLEAAGYLTRTRTGRRTRYTVNQDSLFRHPAQEGQRVGPFLSLLAAAGQDARTTPEPDDTEIGRQQTLRAGPLDRPARWNIEPAIAGSPAHRAGWI
jgi:DNA-binding MarR family transcriptional regulator